MAAKLECFVDDFVSAVNFVGVQLEQLCFQLNRCGIDFQTVQQYLLSFIKVAPEILVVF